LSRTTYADLFAVIGTTFGDGDGSTTFKVPDLRGEFIRGWSADRSGVDVDRDFGSTQGDAIRNITGTVGTVGANSTVNGAFAKISGGVDIDNSGLPDQAVDFDASRVVPTADENRPRNIALLACIKV
jgi:phage-related tail fiber protein